MRKKKGTLTITVVNLKNAGTDFYEQLLALHDLQIQRVEFSPTRITLFCQLKTPHQPCPYCLRSTAEVNQYTSRQVRDLDMSGRQVWLQLRIRQFICQECNRYFSESIGFAQDLVKAIPKDRPNGSLTVAPDNLLPKLGHYWISALKRLNDFTTTISKPICICPPVTLR